MGESNVVISSELILGIISTSFIGFLGFLLSRAVNKIDESFELLWKEVREAAIEQRSNTNRISIIETQIERHPRGK